MDGSSGSGSAGSCSWPSFALFKVSAYLLNYVDSIDARRVQAMPACGDSRTVSDAQHLITSDTPVGTWIKQ